MSVYIPPYTTQQTKLFTNRKGYAVELIVVHETAGRDPGDLNWLVGSGLVSVNWYVGRDSRIVCLEDTQATAHAGVAKWGKHTDPDEGSGGWSWANLASEGIEVSGLNNGDPFTDRQFRSLTDLVRWRLEVNGLTNIKQALVRHKDIAWERGRKSDPMGLNWDRFVAQFTVRPPDPDRRIGGAGGVEYACSAAFADFYDTHGGLLVFGFATTAEYTDADTDGEPCFFMEFENAVIKRKPSMPAPWSLRPILLTEATERVGRGRG